MTVPAHKQNNGKEIVGEVEAKKLKEDSPKDCNDAKTAIQQIEQALEKEDPEVYDSLESLPPAQKRRLIERITTYKELHSGPLPSPRQLEEYARLIPNGADRIMAMTEEQQKHRHVMEAKLVVGKVAQIERGQWFGLLIGLGAIAASLTCILQGHDWAGGIIGIGGITGLVSVFVTGKASKGEEKSKEISKPQDLTLESTGR